MIIEKRYMCISLLYTELRRFNDKLFKENYPMF